MPAEHVLVVDVTVNRQLSKDFGQVVTVNS